MAVKRIKPNVRSNHFEESRAFYHGVIGLDEGDGLDWILFFGTDKREVQLSVMSLDIKAHIHPDVSIEVDDVDAVFARAASPVPDHQPGPVTTEPYGMAIAGTRRASG